MECLKFNSKFNSKTKTITKNSNLKGGNDTLKITNGVFEIDSRILDIVEKKLVKLNGELLNNSNEITKIMMSPIMVHFFEGKKKELYNALFDSLKKNTNVKEIDFNSILLKIDTLKKKSSTNI